MSGTTTRVYVARLAGTGVFDPVGDRVGRVADVVVTAPVEHQQPRVTGLVVEVAGRRRIFLPITRVTSIDAGQVIITGVLNVRRFEQRPGETLVLREMLDRQVQTRDEQPEPLTVSDIGIELDRTRDWTIVKVAAHGRSKRLGRRGQTRILDWEDVTGLTSSSTGQGTANLLATFETMRPADLADVLRELTLPRRAEVAAALDDERLADVLEELDPDEGQVLIDELDQERTADVLGEMEPDDAADLVASLPDQQAELLLTQMEPEDAEDVRRLLSYEETSAGGMMTAEPIVVAPDTTVADALARIRQADLPAAIAATVFVCRPPQDTPTGKFLGAAHFQALLREPPSSLVSGILDDTLEPLSPEVTLEDVSRVLAAYNLVICPVVDSGRLLGAVTVDDVLDHLLGAGWRRRPPRTEVAHGA